MDFQRVDDPPARGGWIGSNESFVSITCRARLANHRMNRMNRILYVRTRVSRKETKATDKKNQNKDTRKKTEEKKHKNER
jgi:hypothetical protein